MFDRICHKICTKQICVPVLYVVCDKVQLKRVFGMPRNLRNNMTNFYAKCCFSFRQLQPKPNTRLLSCLYNRELNEMLYI